MAFHFGKNRQGAHPHMPIPISGGNCVFGSGGFYRTEVVYPARALGLLLADGAPTVGWGKTFWCVGRVPLTKTGVTRKRKVAQ